jgi:hypothetical protein
MTRSSSSSTSKADVVRNCAPHAIAALLWWAPLLVLGGCPTGTADAGTVNPDDLLDPTSCQQCHEAHVAEWEGSMHAYASEDPVCRAMNARGQRETNGELGDFCVQCHAPMAVLTGATADGLNLDEVPQALHGVTCVFCHAVTGKVDEHNAGLTLSFDGVMRGGIEDPRDTAVHASAYSELHDRNAQQSSDMCGPCHDIVTPAGVHLEKTYLEWQGTIYNAPVDSGGLSCAACHMPGRNEPAVTTGDGPQRRVHDHAMVGVDIAITPWPDAMRQRNEVQRFLDTSVYAELCVDVIGGITEVTYTLENLAAGHMFPSGATQDRRVWAELHAFDATGEAFATGVVPDGVPVDTIIEGDPDTWAFFSRAFRADDSTAHMFWDIARIEDDLLPAPGILGPPGDPALHRRRTWTYAGLPPERVTAAVHIRPMALSTLQDLVDSGDLDAALLDRFPTFTLLATELEWTADGPRCVPGSRISTP